MWKGNSACRGATLLSPELMAFLGSSSWDPTVLGGLSLSALLYAAGWRRLRKPELGHPVLAAWRAWCFGGGLLFVWLALLSPIGSFSELFFFMHMIQHLLLVEVAAPLLLLGAPLLPMLWALPRDLRVRLGGLLGPSNPLEGVFTLLTHPMMAVTLYIGALSAWHLPNFYDAAQGRTAIHDLEHLIFLGTALLYWWPIIHPAGGRRRLGYAAAVPYLLPPLLAGSLIGALLTFAQYPLYATYQRVPRLWGISVLQDQQLAGLVMWVPGGLVYIFPIFVLIALLLRQEERAAAALEVEQGRGIDGSRTGEARSGNGAADAKR
ncbi:MAG: cytochrome c oxidase assembly protein [Chloroflexota bacterium]